MTDPSFMPIGTSGEPGRGSGSSRPSRLSRQLAGEPAEGSVAQPSPARDTSPPSAPPTERGSSAAPDVAAEAASGSSPTDAPPEAEAGPGQPTSHHEPTTAEPTAKGIPVEDWLAAAKQGAQEVFGDDWEPRLAAFLAFLRRRITGEYEVDEFGFDPEVTQHLLLAILRPIAQKWFRIEVRGVENIPAAGGALVVANHSGTIPVDGLMTVVTVKDHADRFLRTLGADLVFSLPIVGDLARKSGATLACAADAERLLSGGELVGVFPEGFKGVGKPYSQRYRLQRFGRGGFVAAAIRTQVPIIPCSIVGAEEIYPLVGNIPALARLLGVPYIPITPFFPLLGPLGLIPLPSKWIIEFGEPIRTDAFDQGAAEDPMLVFNVTDQVRETIQQTLYQLLTDRKSVFR